MAKADLDVTVNTRTGDISLPSGKSIGNANERLDVILQEPQTRAFDCEVREVEGESRTLRFVASTEDVASDGDIIRVSAWDTERFEKNPVVLWAHDPSQPPVGRVTRIQKTTGEKPRLETDVEFAGENENHEFAETVFRLFKRGFLKGVSVGFRVRGFEKPDDEARDKLGLGPFGVVITAAELLELSAVPVPADAGALKIGDDDRGALREDYLRVRSFFPDEDRERLDAELEERTDEHDLFVTRTDLTQIITAELTDRLDEIQSTLEDVTARLDALGSPATPAPGSEPEASPYTVAALRALKERNERSR